MASFCILFWGQDCKEIQSVHPKGNQSWIFIGRTDAEAETPILWSSDAKSWFIWKDPDAGKDWGQDEKVTTEDEMVGWHHLHSGHEFEQSPGDDEGQGSLAYCSPWSHRVRDDWMAELNWAIKGVLHAPMNSIAPNLLEKVKSGIHYFMCSHWHRQYLFTCSPQLFPATCLSLRSLRGVVLLAPWRPLPSPGRSLT